MGTFLWKGIEDMSSQIDVPQVPYHWIYNKNLPTISQVRCEQLGKDRVLLADADHEEGDDTILASSIELLCKGWKDLGADVTLHPCPDKTGHADLIKSQWSMNLISELCGTSSSSRSPS